MEKEELQKILFVLEMAKNRLKEDTQFQEYNKEARQYIMEYFVGLAAKQEPLGEEFEKVLNDNLWNLYED